MLLWQVYKTVPKKILIVLSTLVLCFCSVAIILNVGIDNQWGIFTFMIWPSLIVLFVSFEPIFKHRAFSLLGEVSFEMYVWHVSLLTLYQLVRNYLGITTSVSFLKMICFTGILILISFPLTLFVEKKARNFCFVKI